MASIPITRESNFPDKYAARIEAAQQIAPAATTATGTKFDGVYTEAPSAEHPHGVSYISVLVNEAAVLAATP